jgi:hypothetical protein
MVKCNTLSSRDLIKCSFCPQLASEGGRDPLSRSHVPQGQDGCSAAAVAAVLGGKVGGLCVGAEAVTVAAGTGSTGSAVNTGSRIERQHLGL